MVAGLVISSAPAQAATQSRTARSWAHPTRHQAQLYSRVIGLTVWRRVLPPASLAPTRVAAQPPTAAAPPQAPAASDTSAEIALVNQDRASAGLPPLQESAELDKIATARAVDMAQNNYFGHYRPGDPVLAVLELLRADHVPFVWYGENIIWESGMPADQVASYFNTWWMNDAPHRANILNTHYGQIGVGEAIIGDRVIMVEDFTN